MHDLLKKLSITAMTESHHVSHPVPSLLSLLRGHHYAGFGLPCPASHVCFNIFTKYCLSINCN